MYNLGEQFKIDKKRATSNKENMIVGEKFRFTVLTERLIRLEYNDNGIFVDDPTERVLYRDLKKPEFTSNEDSNFVIIYKTASSEAVFVFYFPALISFLSSIKLSSFSIQTCLIVYLFCGITIFLKMA